MANDSSTGGYLSPAGSPAPLEDAALEDLLQKVVVGISGLPGSMVRPRWQATVPKQPEPSVDWCAIGVTEEQQDDYPVEEHEGTGDGHDIFASHETVHVLASFYGPNGSRNAKVLRDGLYVAQNRDQLVANGMNLTDVGRVIAAPELINQQWIRRYDVPIRIRRKVERIYPILNILSAPMDTDTDTHA